MELSRLYEDLRRDEGERRKPYRDTVGKLTAGVGRNLDDVGLRADEIQLMLENDVSSAVYDLDTHLPWWRKLNGARQNALINMCFNLGITRLKGFKRTLSLLEAGAFEAASIEVMNSKWADQVGQRAQRIARAFREGTFE